MEDSNYLPKRTVQEFWMSTNNSSIPRAIFGVFGHCSSCSGPDPGRELDETVDFSSPAFFYVESRFITAVGLYGTSPVPLQAARKFSFIEAIFIASL